MSAAHANQDSVGALHAPQAPQGSRNDTGGFGAAASPGDCLSSLRELHARQRADGLLCGPSVRLHAHAACRETQRFEDPVCFGARSAGGNILALVGRFGNCPVSTTVATLAVSDIFKAMAGKGFAPQAIVRAIAGKLHELFPAGIPTTIQLVDIARELDRVRIVNNSDDVVRLDHPQGAARICDPNPPVSRAAAAQPVVETCAIEPGTRVSLCSDGCTVLEFDCDEALLALPGDTAQTVASRAHEAPPKADGGWDLRLTLRGAELSDCDPVPLIVNQVRELDGGERARSELFTILTELFVNALDHGVLGLDSSLKSGPEGFLAYMTERDARLLHLNDGWVRISIDSGRHENGLLITVADSGSGYEPAETVRALDESSSPRLHGRGLQLVRTLCEEMSLSAGGSETTVLYKPRGRTET